MKMLDSFLVVDRGRSLEGSSIKRLSAYKKEDATIKRRLVERRSAVSLRAQSSSGRSAEHIFKKE
eukprot:314400-Pyramimonas_sp.AAC.1